VTEAAFPLFLRLDGRRVVVVGAGTVATRKVRELLEWGARLTVVAPDVTETLATLARDGKIGLRAGRFAPSDLEDAWLVVAATKDAAVQSEVARVAGERRVWLVAVDDMTNATAYFGAVLRRPPFIVSISSSGATPALTRLIREVLESALPEESWTEAARALRADWKRRGTPMNARFAELVRAFTERLR
jgi:siroheme synthase-like protein